jgi:hypothetical protein
MAASVSKPVSMMPSFRYGMTAERIAKMAGNTARALP